MPSSETVTGPRLHRCPQNHRERGVLPVDPDDGEQGAYAARVDPLVLTPEAKEALGRARDLALGEGYDRAQPHHILAALLEASSARQVLDLYGLDMAGLRITLEHFSRPAFPLDREAEERVLGLAREEARRLGQHEIGAEHLLLALVRQPDTLAAGVLGTFGVTRIRPVRPSATSTGSSSTGSLRARLVRPPSMAAASP